MTNYHLITEDRGMLDLIQLARTVAQSKATVLIQGESGTGKEMIANLIHQNSTRVSKPFVAINCAAIPENLLESELFGYERGAFTGAVSAKSGKFELANGGTILLDEISEMDIRLQAKLLRVIQEGEVDRIGGRRPIPVDVRIVATTNRNLAECVKQGQFREDLYYRLNVVNLVLTPLRDRLVDVAPLAKYFGKHYAAKSGKVLREFSADALRLIQGHAWPGNVRELENILERAVITMKDGVIEQQDIPFLRADALRNSQSDAHHPIAGASPEQRNTWIPGATLETIEKEVILEALKYHQGNRTHTARALGISIRTLRNKLADYRRDGLHV